MTAKPPGGDRAATMETSSGQYDTNGSSTGMAQALTWCPDLVMAKRDPFGFDTEANHIRGRWLAQQLETRRPGRSIHLRGLHYLFQSAQVMIPATSKRYQARHYTNLSAGWLDDTLKYARWLGYVQWERITDERNAEPVIRLRQRPPQPQGWLDLPDFSLDVSVPDVSPPRPLCVGVAAEQPNRIVLAGEKTSLRDVLGEIAEQCGTDLFLCSGDLSDTRIAELAAAAAADGRHCVILWFGDCDPQGWNMPIVLCRKMAGHQYARCPDLSWEVHRVALTPDQVRELDLPECELKGSVKQAQRWREQHGVEQTEIDALAALDPDRLARIALDALSNVFDPTLADSAFLAENRWSEVVRGLVVEQFDGALIPAANADLDQLRAEIGDVYRRVYLAAREIELPEPPEQIQPSLPQLRPEPLCSSEWSFAEQTRRLIADKCYEEQ